VLTSFLVFFTAGVLDLFAFDHPRVYSRDFVRSVCHRGISDGAGVYKNACL
jgi:hypothetical protein